MGAALMPAGNGLLIAGAVAVLLLWGVGVQRRMRRLRQEAHRAFQGLDEMLRAQHDWIVDWCTLRGAELRSPPSAEVWLRRLAASAEQSALALQRVGRNPLDAAAMDGLHQARRALQAAWRAGASHGEALAAPAAPAPTWPPPDWVRLVHQETPLAAAFNARVAAYNAAVSQFPVLLLAALLRRRKARAVNVLEPA